jgi:hypothetical protein
VEAAASALTVWTPIRVKVRGRVTQRSVHGSPQRVLIVNDTKNPPKLGH